MSNVDLIKMLNEQLKEPSSVVFLTGGAGVGKTTLLKKFVEDSDKSIIKLATTGAAALLLGGSTIESALQIPPRVTNPLHDIEVIRRYEKREAVKNADLILIDEVSMLRPDKLDFIDFALRLNCNSQVPFAGKRLLLVGDLYQLPPVVTSSSILPDEYDTPFFFSAKVLKEVSFSTIELTKVYRQNDIKFIDALNSVRLGEATIAHLDYLNLKVVKSAPSDAVTLAPYNESIFNLNKQKLSEIKDNLYQITAEVEGKIGVNDFIVDKDLFIKIGARVVLTRNSMNGSYVNGSIGVVKDIDLDGPITVELDTGNDVEIQKEVWQKTESTFSIFYQRNEQKVIGTIKQYPIKLAWGISIHKSQGATYDKAHIDLGRGAFAAGQLYVALSRLKSYEGLSLARPIRQDDIIVDQRINDFFKHSKIIRL